MSANPKKRKGTNLLIVLIILVTIIPLAIIFVQWNLTQSSIDLNSPLAQEAQTVVWKMILLKTELLCFPENDVSALSEVMIDSTDYHLTKYDKEVIERIYGKDALPSAGLLTATKAEIMYRRRTPPSDTSITGTGMRPTIAPSYKCSSDYETHTQSMTQFLSVIQQDKNHLKVNYRWGSGEIEVNLTRMNDRWMVTSLKVIEPNRG